MRHLVERLLQHDGLHDDLDDVSGDVPLANSCRVEPLGAIGRATEDLALVGDAATVDLECQVDADENGGEEEVEFHLSAEHALSEFARASPVVPFVKVCRLFFIHLLWHWWQQLRLFCQFFQCFFFSAVDDEVENIVRNEQHASKV